MRRAIPLEASAYTSYRRRKGRTLTSSELKAIYLIKARHPGRRAAPVRDLLTYGRLTGENAWQREPSGDPGHLLRRFRDDAKIFIPGRRFAAPVHPCKLRTGTAPAAAPALFRHTASNPSHSIRQNPLPPSRRPYTHQFGIEGHLSSKSPSSRKARSACPGSPDVWAFDRRECLAARTLWRSRTSATQIPG